MKSDLKNYNPKEIEYVLEEAVCEQFPVQLDFLSLSGKKLLGSKQLKSKRNILEFVGKHFTATFPDNELVTRKLDEFEIKNIREEYCTLQENVVPERKQHLEEALEEAKRMKKEAEEAYQSALMEIAKYAAEVKRGIRDMRLKSTDVFCIALAGYYLVYVWDEGKKMMVLAKAYTIPDRSEIWANEEKNRKTMLDVFGLEFPEVEQPKPEDEAGPGTDNYGEALPFGDEEPQEQEEPAEGEQTEE